MTADISPAFALKKKSKIEIYTEIERYLKMKNMKELGFSLTNLPNKCWLLDILKYLN